MDGGDKPGKTISFAKNHKDAFPSERFNALYPHLTGDFARVMDNKVIYFLSLIDLFGEKPCCLKWQSVGMLDTGIDVLEVVNLVFFKPEK